MRNFATKIALGALLLTLAACSSVNPFSPKREATSPPRTADNREIRQPVTLAVLPYQDARLSVQGAQGAPTRKIGSIRSTDFYAFGSRDITLPQDPAEMVTEAMRGQFGQAGFEVNAAGAANFTLSGVVRELRLEIERADRLAIVVESNLHDAAGNVIWSGVVTERADKIEDTDGGVDGLILRYVQKGLTGVAGQTRSQINASLKQAYPEIFRQSERIYAAQTAQRAPAAALPAPVAVAPTFAPPPPHPAAIVAASNAVTPPPAPAPVMASTPAPAPAAPAIVPGKGLLVLTTTPSRAQLSIGDVYFGLSPIKLDLAPGVHALNIKLSGYKTVNAKVSVRLGEVTEYDLRLAK